MSIAQMEEIEYCKVAIHYEEDIEKVIAKRNEIVGLMKDHKLPGFRQGKATPEAIKILLKNEIKDSLTKELVSEAIHNSVSENNIKPFGRPQINSYSLDGDKFVCDFSLHIQPKFDLNKYKEFEIPKPKQSMTVDEMTQKTLQDLRNKQGAITPYTDNDSVQNGDNIIVDYKAFVDEQPIPRLTAEGELVVVGTTPIPDFDNQLLNMKPGEEKTFSVKMPEDIEDTLASKEITFTVKIVIGSKVEPMPLDDSLAQKLGMNNIQELMNNIKAMADSKIQETEHMRIINQISHRLVSEHDFKIPAWLSSAEAQFQVKNSGENWEVLPDEQKEKYVISAENSIKLSLILNEIRNNEPDAQLTEEETFNSLKEQLKNFSSNPEEALQTLVNNGQLPILLNRIKDDFALGFIKKTCSIVE